MIARKGAWEIAALDPNEVVSHATPYVMRHTRAVHVLTTKPLTSSHGKKMVAKELMLWEGANCYFCLIGGAPPGSNKGRYIALDAAILNVMPPAFHQAATRTKPRASRGVPRPGVS